jgi:serine/threonine protein kinase
MLSLEGQQLGNYDVIRRIRAGGMGAVYEGRQRTAFGRRVAIKVILGDYAADRDMRRRFAREARTVAGLHHPHILPLIEFGDEKGILYLVMPFIDGGTLTSYLRRYLPGLEDVSALYQQLLDAVEYAHDQGLIHRDIKSSNVLLEERRSGSPYAYLADFGLVRTTRQSANAQAGKSIPLDQVPGTPHYMAPEQTRGIVTTLTDIYALGVLLYQMLTGELPYNDEDDVRVIQMHLQSPIPVPSTHDASIPRELDDVVRKAMAKRPEDRYRNIAELRQAFKNAMRGASTAPIPIPETEDELIIEEVEEDDFSPPIKRIPTPLQLQEPVRRQDIAPRPQLQDLASEPQSLPEEAEDPTRPDREQPRPRPDVVPVALQNDTPKETMQRVRPAETPQGAVPRVRKAATQRITEEPEQLRPKLPPRRKRSKQTGGVWALATGLVSLLLIALILMPRFLGISIFPAGFPLLGAAPVATVYITPQSKMLQDSYVLTASPQVKQADVVTRTIPARVLADTASGRSTAPTTGTKNDGGAQAQGRVVFTNSGDTDVDVPNTLVLTTPSGIHFQVTQGFTVPAQQNGRNGKVTVTVTAQQPGASGNIAPHALDGTCCNDMLTVKNNDAFTGGTDPQVTHIVVQSDIDGVRNSLVSKLKAQILQQLRPQLQTGEVIAGQPSYQITATSNVAVGSPADHVQVNVSVVAQATAYSSALATRTAAQLLRASATQNLGPNYQAQSDPTVTAPPGAQPGSNGSAYISISVHGLWSYALSEQQFSQWRQSIRGATLAAAQAYLKAQPGIANFQINLPFGADHIPDAVDEIKIVTVNP